MLHSFLDSNPWFDGEIILVHSHLPQAATKKLEDQFGNLHCKSAEEALAQAITSLVEHFPHLEDRRDRFLSLETLLLPDARPTLFLDSDILVRGDLSDLATIDAALVACPDASILRGRSRDPLTMEELQDPGEGNSFNAGMLMLGDDALNTQRLERMFEYLQPESWQAIRSDHTDQAVWNRLFPGEVQLASPDYNFMVGHTELQDVAEAEWNGLRILHFNGPAKPWLPDRHQAAVAQGGLRAWAFEQWRMACSNMLAHRVAK
jgi:lipopolysaccharide biosynthesis glycosyltransferase